MYIAIRYVGNRFWQFCYGPFNSIEEAEKWVHETWIPESVEDFTITKLYSPKDD